MRSRAGRLVVLGVLSGLALTACGQSQPGVAASVGSEELPVSELQAQTEAFFTSYPEARGQASPVRVAQVQIQNWVHNRVVDDIAEAYGIEPSQGDLEAIAEEQFEGMEGFTQAVANAAVPSSRPDLVMAELRSYWIQNTLREQLRDELGLPEGQNDELDIATQDINEEFSAARDIAVNPRYGDWDPTASSVIDAEGSISITEDEANGILEDPSNPAG